LFFVSFAWVNRHRGGRKKRPPRGVRGGTVEKKEVKVVPGWAERAAYSNILKKLGERCLTQNRPFCVTLGRKAGGLKII